MDLTMGAFLFPVAWANPDSDNDGMPDSFENQYLGEVMFEDHFDDGTLDPAWVMKLTYWEEAEGKLKTVPEVLPGFKYGHGGNGRGPLIVLHEGDSTWTNYSYEFTCSSLGVVPKLNPHSLPIGFKGRIGTSFRVQEQPASWNEPANYLYSFNLQVTNEVELASEVGYWKFSGAEGTYIPGTRWSPNYEGARYTFTEGNSPFINQESQPNHVNVLVKGNKMYAWVNGVFVGDAVDSLNISPYGGISFSTSWEAMAWYDDVVVRSVGLNPNLPDAHLDYDNDGFTNLEEYYNNTNPMVPELPGNCEHATYSLKRRLLTVPFVEIPVIDFLTGQLTSEMELWTSSLRQVSGTTNRFRLINKTVAKITDGSSSSCPATYAVETGTLNIPYLDVPTGIAVGNKKFENGVDVFKATMTWEPMGKSFVVQKVEQSP
jgi:hypothetical protein